MIDLIGAEIALFLADLPFADRVAGLVKEINVQEEEGSRILRYPAYFDKRPDDLRDSYTDLVPDDRKRSIMYVENFGTKVGERHRQHYEMTTRLRVVGWGRDLPVLAAGYIIAELPEALTVASVGQVSLRPTAILGIDEKLFARYTYKEEELQFLLAPFSAFAVDFETSYRFDVGCLPSLLPLPDPEPIQVGYQKMYPLIY